MYNEELENLIEAALADGELTEKEKQVLLKKAQSLGIDLDEFEMVLNARLMKLKKTSNPASTVPHKNKMGDVKKCPACGAMVQSYQGICPECGYYFENVSTNSTVQKLSEELEKKGMFKTYSDDSDDLEEEDFDKMASIIKRFPIPNAKADIIELIMLIQTQLTALKDQEYASSFRNACLAKLQECSLKAKHIFPNDKQILNLLEETKSINNQLKKDRKKAYAKRAIIGAILIVMSLLVGYLIWGLHWKVIWRVVTLGYTSLPLFSWGLIMIADKKE